MDKQHLVNMKIISKSLLSSMKFEVKCVNVKKNFVTIENQFKIR